MNGNWSEGISDNVDDSIESMRLDDDGTTSQLLH